MRSMLSENDKVLLKKRFEELEHDVELVVFTQEYECEFCKSMIS